MNIYEPIEPVLLPGEQSFVLTQPDGSQVRGYFHDTGNGPVGVFVHGFRSQCNGEKSMAFARHAREQGWSWLRFDMRGHGLSDGVLEKQYISDALADLQSVFSFTAERPLILLASSMGGWISLLAALRAPARVKGMVMIAPAFNFIQQNFGSLPADILAVWERNGTMNFPDAYGGEPYAVEFPIIEDARPYDVLAAPVEIDVPLHIIHGDDDVVVPLASTQQFISNARADGLVLEVVSGGDHRLTDHISLITRHLDRVWQEIQQ